MMVADERDGLYIAFFSVHGLLRGEEMELGRDADTGGQIKYVVELARAAAADPRVARIDLITRLVEDPKVDESYAEPLEDIGPNARIIRLPFGPRRYLRKEVLWPHLPSLVDRSLQHFRRVGRVPDLLHGHYADGGWVVARLAAILGVPMVQTGHSLGRVKRGRLREKGMKDETIESQFNIAQRIEAEEIALENANFVIASTQQEVDEQYAHYEQYEPQRMVVIPPGVDLGRFSPPKRGDKAPAIQKDVDRFLDRPNKPMILAISRADTRKNIGTLVQAYGESEELQELANLVIVAGNRDDIAQMDREPREVLTDLLLKIDRYDLYGKIAIPKHHRADDVPLLYRLAARRRGVFVNPALTEPFGLTLLEAAASGLPVVATNDGGPFEILARCENGELVDPLDSEAIAEAIASVLRSRERWRKLSQSGLKGVERHYSWKAHVRTYLRNVRRMATRSRRLTLMTKPDHRLAVARRFLITDIDNTLLGDNDALAELLDVLRKYARHVGFGVATGRRLESALEVLKEHEIPRPNVLITSVGAEIHYGSTLDEDEKWARHIDYRWEGSRVRELLLAEEGLELQPEIDQRRHKVSFYYEAKRAPSLAVLRRKIRNEGLRSNLILSHDRYLDALPVRASKGRAVRYVCTRWGIPMHDVLVAGDSGNDEEMLAGETLAVVVGNHSAELAKLRGREGIYFSERGYARGIIDGLERYDFLRARPQDEGGHGGEGPGGEREDRDGGWLPAEDEPKGDEPGSKHAEGGAA